MDEARDVIWRNIQPLLNGFAERIAASDPAVICFVKSTSNESFLLRGYASLRKTAVGEEIAVTVDAAFENGGIILSSDACMDNGEVLAEGPVGFVPLSAILTKSVPPLAEWLDRFKDFLSRIEATVKERAAAL